MKHGAVRINYTYQVEGQAIESVSQSYSYDEMIQVMLHLERGMGTATSHAQQKGFAKNRQGALRNGAIINIETDSKTFEASAGGDATASVEVAVNPDGINYEIHPSWMPAALGKGCRRLFATTESARTVSTTIMPMSSLWPFLAKSQTTDASVARRTTRSAAETATTISSPERSRGT